MSEVVDYRKPGKGNPGGSGYTRHPRDWYVESPACVDALLDVEAFPGVVLDPACGGGNIPRQFEARGLKCYGSDIANLGFGVMRDFLSWIPGGGALQPESVVTNPPFKLALRFVQHAMLIGATKIAILQRTAFLEGQERGKFFRANPPARIWQFSSRQSMPPGDVAVTAAGGKTAYAWLVWEGKTERGETRFDWLP